MNVEHHGKCPSAQAWDIPNVPCDCPRGWPRTLRELTVERYQSTRKKPGPTARYRAKRKRADDAERLKVRADCVDRDGYCRLMGLSLCSGESEHAHLEDQKRARTRGMPPAERHTTAGSAMFCRWHHSLYDRGGITLAMTERGADGPIRAQLGEKVRVC